MAGTTLGGVSGGGSKTPAVTLPTTTVQDPVAPLQDAADDVVQPVVDGAAGTVQGATEPVTDAVGDAGKTVEETTGVPVPPLP
jgi:hypothetical protein